MQGQGVVSVNVHCNKENNKIGFRAKTRANMLEDLKAHCARLGRMDLWLRFNEACPHAGHLSIKVLCNIASSSRAEQRIETYIRSAEARPKMGESNWRQYKRIANGEAAGMRRTIKKQSAALALSDNSVLQSQRYDLDES